MSVERGRIVLLTVGGAAVAGVVLFVASQLDDSGSSQRRPSSITDAVDLVNPTPLTEGDKRTGASISGQPLAELERGAWVQVTDGDGRLAQQYSAERVEPLPDRRLSFERPQAIFYREDGRVITLSADRGEARVPSKALESGRLEGNVVIRVFRPEPGTVVDLATDAPTILVNAEDATFDNVVGEVRCDGDIDLVSAMGSFSGEGLDMRIGTSPSAPPGATGVEALQKGTLERLVIERARKPIVLVRDAQGKTRMRDARTAPPPTPTPTPGAAPAPTVAAAAPAAKSQVYRLTLNDDVRVVREKGNQLSTLQRSTLQGDALVARFTLEGENSLNAIAQGTPRAPAAPTGGDPASTVLGAVFAAPQASPGAGEETITIEYRGQLVLEPERAVTLPSPDAVEVEMISVPPANAPAGTPTNRVTLDDERTGAHVVCRRVAFANARGADGADDLIEAFGAPNEPLVLDSPRLKARGERFFLQRGKGIGGFVGPGSVELASGGESFAALAIDPSTATVSRDAANVTHLRVAAASSAPSSVAIAWQRSLDLVFAAPAGGAKDDNGALETATFVGTVDVTGEGFELDAETLAATFAGEAKKGSDVRPLSRIEATGNEEKVVVARRTDGTAGELRGRSLDLALVTDGARDSVPSRLVASGIVAARDAKQAIYGEKLVADFVRDAAAEPKPPSDAGTPGQDLGRELSTVVVEGGNTETGLQVELFGTPSTRVFAEKLDGDNAAQSLNLTGPDIWLVRDLVVADRITNVHFDGGTRTASSKGPGRVRAFRTPFALPSGPVPRPTIPGQATDGTTPERFVATWDERFDFTELDAATNGSVIALKGAVRVRNTPSRAATDAIDAADLRLELTDAAKAPDAGNAERASVRAVEARGDAVVESRQWSSPARDGDPRLFKLAGAHLRYDTQSREGWVDGAGTLLTHVPLATSDRKGTIASEPVDGAVKGDPLSFGAEGTSQFKWATRLDMTRDGGDARSERFHITMTDGVEIMHKGPEAPKGGAKGGATNGDAANDLDWLSMSAAKVETWVRRPAPNDGAAGDRPSEPAATPMDLGGTAEIERVLVLGNEEVRIYVRTNSFDLECDEIDYDVASGVAKVTARDGRLAKVLDRKGSQPISAQFLEWNLATGQIVVKGAQGTVGR
ncbi:MAG: hypothetical protein JNM94_03305 [Phycisphaerae bacterium]|nr:hypothetical protein [Phycisphaerae bacterium]